MGIARQLKRRLSRDGLQDQVMQKAQELAGDSSSGTVRSRLERLRAEFPKARPICMYCKARSETIDEYISHLRTVHNKSVL